MAMQSGPKSLAGAQPLVISIHAGRFLISPSTIWTSPLRRRSPPRLVSYDNDEVGSVADGRPQMTAWQMVRVHASMNVEADEMQQEKRLRARIDAKRELERSVAQTIVIGVNFRT